MERPDLDAIRIVANYYVESSAVPHGMLATYLMTMLIYAERLERELAAARGKWVEMDAALQRWLAACDAFDDAKSGSSEQHEAWMGACEAELAVKTLAAAIAAPSGKDET
jgi:hypothetical protein